MQDEERIIGEYHSGKNGSLLFVTAGIHGNEPSGVYALQKIFKTLHKEKPSIHGKIVGIKGNIKALKKNVRFIDEDLNRVWTKENISSRENDSYEKKEMNEIIKLLNQYPKEEFTKRYFLDCHTTSSNSAPYNSVQDVYDNVKWAKKFPIHIVRGFSDIIKGDIDHYESRIGFTGFVCEAGQHESKISIRNHEGIIWLALQQAAQLNFNDLNNYPKAAGKLEEMRNERKIFDIKYRHDLKPSDEFKMKKGYNNFQKIRKGDLLAYQNGNSLYSKWDAYIFMPLYQDQGDDGFFILQECTTN